MVITSSTLRTSTVPSTTLLRAFRQILRSNNGQAGGRPVDHTGNHQRKVRCSQIRAQHSLSCSRSRRASTSIAKVNLPKPCGHLYANTHATCCLKTRRIGARRSQHVSPDSRRWITSSIARPAFSDPGESRSLYDMEYIMGHEEVDIQSNDEISSESQYPLVKDESGIRYTRHITESSFNRSVQDGGPEVDRPREEFLDALSDQEAGIEKLYRLYLTIPEPRLRYLSDRTITALLARIRNCHVKTQIAKSFYFTVMDDMHAVQIKMTVRNLTSAMSFLGRSHKINRKKGLQDALDILDAMDRHGTYKAEATTFNTLGFLALSADERDVVMIILKEMKRRGILPDRFTHVLLLSYYGAMRDIAGIRNAYKEMVQCGEIIDTIALNAVLKALLLADDFVTAEKVFENMKRANAAKSQTTPPPSSWTHQRKLGHILKFAAHELRKHGHLRSQVQETAPVAPNSHTYRLLIEYHCKRTGDLDRIQELLSEMVINGMPITAPIFYVVFTGFHQHERARFSAWRLWSLFKIFDLFIASAEWLRGSRSSVVDDRIMESKFVDGFDVRLIEAILKAFSHFRGGKLPRDIYKRIKKFFDPDPKWDELLSRMVDAPSARSISNTPQQKGLFQAADNLVLRSNVHVQ